MATESYTRGMAPYLPAENRYDSMQYRRCGHSGLLLPAVSLGLWQNFGDGRAIESQRAIAPARFRPRRHPLRPRQQLRTALRAAPRRTLGRLLREDFSSLRDELIISTKAGWDMWPGPYGELGSRKYLLASLDQSLTRMGLDYVDIFYHHRFDPDTPLEETLGALDTAVRQGKALYVGISSYSDVRTHEAVAILKSLGTPLLIHQPSYSMFNRWIEDRLLDVLGRNGVGCIAFSPFAQGLLTESLPRRHPQGSRASKDGSLSRQMLNEENLEPRSSPARDRDTTRPASLAARHRVGAARPARHLGAARRQLASLSWRKTSPPWTT